MMLAACVHLVKYMHTHNREQHARVARVVGGRGGVWKKGTPKDSLWNQGARAVLVVSGRARSGRACGRVTMVRGSVRMPFHSFVERVCTGSECSNVSSVS